MPRQESPLPPIRQSCELVFELATRIAAAATLRILRTMRRVCGNSSRNFLFSADFTRLLQQTCIKKKALSARAHIFKPIYYSSFLFLFLLVSCILWKRSVSKTLLIYSAQLNSDIDSRLTVACFGYSDRTNVCSSNVHFQRRRKFRTRMDRSRKLGESNALVMKTIATCAR